MPQESPASKLGRETPATFKGSEENKTPLFSVVMAVYNDWTPLDRCLQSLSEQTNPPDFEVIIVDDGSGQPAPEFIGDWSRFFPLTLIRQGHSGISAARNRGIQISRGSVLVFADADCRFQMECLAQLGSAIADSTQRDYFQLHLVGDRSRLVGRTEELRLLTVQEHLLQPNGCIRYLNTAGFALRRARVDIEKGAFDPAAVRAEDTLLLANLMQNGELPFFVPEAIIEHAIPLSLSGCLRKDFRSGYLEEKTYEIIASKGVKIRVGHGDRFSMLLAMWKTSSQRSIGRSAWFVLTLRQILRRIAGFVFRCLHSQRKSRNGLTELAI